MEKDIFILTIPKRELSSTQEVYKLETDISIDPIVLIQEQIADLLGCKTEEIYIQYVQTFNTNQNN